MFETREFKEQPLLKWKVGESPWHPGAPNNMENKVCKWIGDGEGCRHPTIYSKSYCEFHYQRVYLSLLPEMAEFILEKELKQTPTSP